MSGNQKGRVSVEASEVEEMSIRRCLVVLALFLGACGGNAAGPGTDATTIPEPSTSTTIAPGGDQMSEDLVERATADLATRLEVDQAEIEVISVESGVWSDGSIGCPEPGKMYTQALVTGHRVILAHDGESYSYHQGGSQSVVLCDEPAEGAFTGVEGDRLIPPPGYDE